jgi:hypothetical protein
MLTGGFGKLQEENFDYSLRFCHQSPEISQ